MNRLQGAWNNGGSFTKMWDGQKEYQLLYINQGTGRLQRNHNGT
jgi:hypothetical protein